MSNSNNYKKDEQQVVSFKTFAEEGFGSFYQEHMLLFEKQMIVGKGKKYGQVVFLAGGAGSGKSFAIQNYMEGEKFKIIDSDQIKKIFIKIVEEKNKYPELKNLNFRNPDDVRKMHLFLRGKAIKEKQLETLFVSILSGESHGLAKGEKKTLPNLMFDITLKDTSDLEEILPLLILVGYEPKSIHLIWILTNLQVAMQQNLQRERIVPEDILIQTHEGAAINMHDIIFGKDGKLPVQIDGEIYVALGGPKNTIFYEPSDNSKNKKALVVKDFQYLKVKKAGKKVLDHDTATKEIKTTLLKWILSNIPKTTKTAKIFRTTKD